MLTRSHQPIRWMWRHMQHTPARLNAASLTHSSPAPLIPHLHCRTALPPSFRFLSTQPSLTSSSSTNRTPLNPGAQPHGDSGLDSVPAPLSPPTSATSSPSSPTPPLNTGETYQENAATLTATPAPATPPPAPSSSSSPSSPASFPPPPSQAAPAPPPPLPPAAAPAPAVPPPLHPPTPSHPTSRAAHPGFLLSDQQVFLSDGRQVAINDLFKDRRVLLLGFVAAYTRLCQQSLIAYHSRLSELKKKHGVDAVVAVAVNDHSVLSSFSSSLSISPSPALTLIADFDARVTRWLGMEVDLSVVGFGLRCKRFAMLVDRQQVKVVRVESNVGVLDVTSVDSMLVVLKEMKAEEERREKEREREAREKDKEKAMAMQAEQRQLEEEEQKIPPLVQ